MFSLLLCFSHPLCFHRNTGTDSGVSARQRCLCDPDSGQVRQNTHISENFSVLLKHHPYFKCFSCSSSSLCLDPLRDVNTTIMEMLIMVYACRTSCARSITGVLPYFPYSKQCKMRKRGSIVSKLIASMMCKAGTFRAAKLFVYITLQHHNSNFLLIIYLTCMQNESVQ